MGDEEEIPIPRGAYTINWDEIDEFADPFAMSKPPGMFLMEILRTVIKENINLVPIMAKTL